MTNFEGGLKSAFSGQGSIRKPALKVYPIIATIVAGVSTTVFNPLPQAGSCLMYVRGPLDIIGTVQCVFDEVQYDSNGTIKNLITLNPGDTFDLRPGQFNTATIIVTAPANLSGTNVSFGSLVIGDAYYTNAQGGNPSNPTFVQPGQRTQFQGMFLNAAAGSVSAFWAQLSTTQGMFNYQWTNPILLTIGAFYLGYKVTYRNVGSNILYVATRPNLTNTPANVQTVFPISPGAEETFEGSPASANVNTIPQYIYTQDPNAIVAATTLIYGY